MTVRSYVALVLAVMPALALASPVPKHPPSGDGIRKALAAEYAALNRAFRRKDANGVLAHMTPDFQWVKADKTTVGRAQTAQALRQQFAGIGAITDMATSIDILELHGRDVVATVTGRMSCTASDRSGTKHRISQTQVSRATWVKTPAGLRLRRSELISSQRQVDGQPLDPLDHPPLNRSGVPAQPSTAR